MLKANTVKELKKLEGTSESSPDNITRHIVDILKDNKEKNIRCYKSENGLKLNILTNDSEIIVELKPYIYMFIENIMIINK